MTIYSGIFNSINGDRKYNAWWFAKYFATFIGNGVFPNPSTGLQVMADERMQVKVRAGSGWIDGYFLYSDDDYVLGLDKSDGLSKRIDRIVMRLNHTTRQIEIAVKKGAFASAPVAPTLQRDTDYVELALADVAITNGTTIITQADITDTRLNKTLCGIVHGTVNQVDTTTLFNQYQSWIEQQKSLYESDLATWTAEQKQDFKDWQALNENQFAMWKNDFETAATNWFAQEQTDFETWFATLQVLLDENIAAALTAKVQALETGKANQKDLVEISDLVDELEQTVTQHLAQDATTTSKGHVQIGSNIDVSGGTISVKNASTSQKGVVQLNNTTTSTSTTQAATANAAKQAYDRAEQAFQAGNSRKSELVDELLSLDGGLPIDVNDSWQDVIGAIGGISTGKKWASGTQIFHSSTLDPDRNVISGLGFTPTKGFLYGAGILMVADKTGTMNSESYNYNYSGETYTLFAHWGGSNYIMNTGNISWGTSEVSIVMHLYGSSSRSMKWYFFE